MVDTLGVKKFSYSNAVENSSGGFFDSLPDIETSPMDAIFNALFPQPDLTQADPYVSGADHAAQEDQPVIATDKIQEALVTDAPLEVDNTKELINIGQNDVQDDITAASAVQNGAEAQLHQIEDTINQQENGASQIAESGQKGTGFSERAAGVSMNLVGGAIVGKAADLVVPGAGMVIGAAMTAFSVNGKGTFGDPGMKSEFDVPLKKGRGKNDVGYKSSSPSQQDIMKKASASNSTQPVKGSSLDEGRVGLAEDSLKGLKIGGARLGELKNAIAELGDKCHDAQLALDDRQTNGVTLGVEEAVDMAKTKDMALEDLKVPQQNKVVAFNV